MGDFRRRSADQFFPCGFRDWLFHSDLPMTPLRSAGGGIMISKKQNHSLRHIVGCCDTSDMSKTTTLRLRYGLAQRVFLLWLLMLIAKVQAQDFTYTTNNGSLTITGYTGPGGDVIIPSEINNLPVTGVGGGAFDVFQGRT